MCLFNLRSKNLATALNRCLLSLLVTLFAACASVKPPVESTGSKNGIWPELKNYTNFPSILLFAEGERGQFYTSILKVSYDIDQDGNLSFASKQQAISNYFSFPSDCPLRPITVQEQDPFKIQAEWYLLPGKEKFKSNAKLKVGSNVLAIKDPKGCAALSNRQAMSLTPYPKPEDKIILEGMTSKASLELSFPSGFLPFQLVRYVEGQMIPAPSYPDTFVINLETRQLEVTYRTTIAYGPQIRVLEYRAIPEDLSVKDSKDRVRNEFMRKFLNRCQPPSLPPDDCVNPEVLVDLRVFGAD